MNGKKGKLTKAHKDLRSFLECLEQEGQLLRIKDAVWPELDIAAAACAASEMGDQSPALQFENIQGYTKAKIAMNVHGSWPNIDLPPENYSPF